VKSFQRWWRGILEEGGGQIFATIFTGDRMSGFSGALVVAKNKKDKRREKGGGEKGRERKRDGTKVSEVPRGLQLAGIISTFIA